MKTLENSTTVRAYGESFVVAASSVQERRDVERVCKELWLEYEETSLSDMENLVSIEAYDWLNF